MGGGGGGGGGNQQSDYCLCFSLGQLMALLAVKPATSIPLSLFTQVTVLDFTVGVRLLVLQLTVKNY